MRYLPLTEHDRARCCGASASTMSMPCSPTCRRTSCSAGFPICRGARARWRSSACSAAWPRRNIAGRHRCRSSSAAGAYKHHVPASVDHLIQRSEFLTSYTPYQPEIAQGTLQYLFEFQTQVAMLTGMEVANASMYDGSTATAEAVLMAHRVTKRAQGGALRQPASALSRDGRHACRGMAGDAVVAPAAATGGRARTCSRRSTARRVLRRGADARRLRQSARPARRSPSKAHASGALLIAVVTEVVSLGLRDAARRDGRRHRRRRGPVDRQRAELRRALCRPVRDAAEIRAPDAGPPVRRDRRCRGPARLRADAVDARAAHPPREGDLQHLHQFRPVRARLHHPSDPAGRGRADAARRGSIMPTRSMLADRLAAVPGVEVLNETLLQRVHHPRAGRRRRR